MIVTLRDAPAPFPVNGTNEERQAWLSSIEDEAISRGRTGGGGARKCWICREKNTRLVVELSDTENPYSARVCLWCYSEVRW